MSLNFIPSGDHDGREAHSSRGTQLDPEILQSTRSASTWSMKWYLLVLPVIACTSVAAVIEYGVIYAPVDMWHNASIESSHTRGTWDVLASCATTVIISAWPAWHEKLGNSIANISPFPGQIEPLAELLSSLSLFPSDQKSLTSGIYPQEAAKSLAFRKEAFGEDYHMNVGGMKVRFEQRLPALSSLDRIKNFIQLRLSQKIVWWPLAEPKDTPKPDFTRLTWNCVSVLVFGGSKLTRAYKSKAACTSQIHVDMQNTLAQKLRKHFKHFDGRNGQQKIPRGGEASSQPNEIILPSQTVESSLTSFSISNSTPIEHRSRMSDTSGNSNQGPSPDHGHFVLNMPNASTRAEKYVHWCVDSSVTSLHNVCVEALNGAIKGKAFILELQSSYNRLRGLRRWLSLTTCANVKLVQFVRLFDNQHIVSCVNGQVSVTKLLETGKYEFVTSQSYDDRVHILWVENTLAHYLRNHCTVDPKAVDELIARVPKTKEGRISSKARSTGYGLHAKQGWSLWKFLIALAVCSVLSLVFFAYWLHEHPGDLQNASVPYFMALGLLGAAVILPDIYIL